jgi:2'-5' RNA ligase
MPLTVPSLILTLRLDPTVFEVFNQLRQQHFPSERNFLPAHVTLFHKLPGDQEQTLQQTLKALCSHTLILPLSLPKLRFLGRGVAVEVDCPDLVQLRNQLAQEWQAWLTPQDQQTYRPHITIQNKVTSETARQLYNQLKRMWRPIDGQGEGLLLWYYRGGPWELVSEFDFKPQVKPEEAKKIEPENIQSPKVS